LNSKGPRLLDLHWEVTHVLIHEELFLDIIKELLLTVITEEQEERLFRIDQEVEPSWIDEKDLNYDVPTTMLSLKEDDPIIDTTTIQNDEETSYIWVI
jgi:hypothetical protein